MSATLTTLAELIVELYSKAWVDALIKNTFLLTRLEAMSNIKTGEGDGIRWPVRYAGNSAVGSYGEGDSGAGAGKQDSKQAHLPWKYNRCEISVSGPALAVGAAGGMLVSPLRFELENGLLDLRAAVNSQLMADGAGNSGKDITGLFAGIGDTGTYAGIDRGTYTWWKSYVNSNGGTNRALTQALMRDVKTNVESRGGMVTAIYCGPAQWYAYGDLLEGERRQIDEMLLTGGYRALDYEGVPVIKVPGYPAHRMDFVDETQIEYQMLPVASSNIEISGLRNVAAVPGRPGFGILVLGATKDTADFWIIHYSQLWVKNPYRMGSLQDLT